MKHGWGWVLPALVLLVSTRAVPSGTPVLPEGIAHDANDLQRAVWAGEGGAPHFEQASKAGAAVRPRFFLGEVDDSADRRSEPPLTLTGNRLSGLGGLSKGDGWFNIRFDCTLAGDLRQAIAFSYETLSPMPQNSAPPDTSGWAEAPDADRMRWYVEGLGRTYLVHGVRGTDNRDFVASCVEGSGEITITLTKSVPWLNEDTYLLVKISDGPGSGLYIVRGTMDGARGPAMPVFTISAEDPLMTWLARGQNLLISLASEAPYQVSLQGSAQPARTLALACH